MGISVAVHHGSFHLAEEQVDDASSRCPICMEPSTRRSLFVIQQNPTVEMLACSRCDGASASRMPREGVVDQAYRQLYRSESRSVTHADSSRFARPILKHFRAERGSALRILDFGGGDGSLALAVADALLREGGAVQAAIDVVDFHPTQQVTRCDIEIGQFTELDEVTGPFDLVIASAVLEHIPAVNEVLGKLLGLTRLGGLLYARTPWSVPIRRVSKAVDILYPGHVHDMGGDFWNRFPEGFQHATRILVSGPSPVETSLREAPLRTMAAHLLKSPARLEARCRGVGQQSILWRFVGGWQVLLEVGERRAEVP